MFNESQLGAISHHLGPAIILAGPGSGKTTVITHRVKNLIKEYNVPPERILVVTFTKAAAVNMEQRFLKVINENSPTVQQIYPVTFGTFHSIYYRILRLTYNYRGDNVISERQRTEILSEISVRLKIDVPSLQDFVQNVSGEISNVKGNMLDIKQFQSVQCHNSDFEKLFIEYNKELKTMGKMDFDDILVGCYELLKNHPEILKKWQNIYSHILIDEFQDINKIQYEIIKMLAKPEDNIFIVGDDDQSIYGFRGAKPEIMHQFLDDFPSAKEILLNINYRCCENIVNWAENLIEKNTNRFNKKIVAENDTSEKLEIKQFKNQQEELSYVADKIKDYINKGIKPDEIAILVRNNSQIPAISQTLALKQVNSNSKNKKNYLYENPMAKDIISYIKAALTYDTVPIKENEDLIKVINKPSRFISRQLIAEDNANWDRLKQQYRGTIVGKKIDKLLFDLKIIKMATPFAAITYVRNGVGYDKYIKELAREKGFKFQEVMRQMDKLQQEASCYKSLDDWLETIEGQSHNKITDGISGVNILTMHGSKGLEFKVVFIVDANQGVVPSSKAVREKDFEEERRVFYVAMTRASKILNIYGIKEVLGCEIQMSMFVSEMLRIDEN